MIPSILRLPVSATLLTSFVVHGAGSYSGKTINAWMAGIRFWHLALVIEHLVLLQQYLRIPILSTLPFGLQLWSLSSAVADWVRPQLNAPSTRSSTLSVLRPFVSKISQMVTLRQPYLFLRQKPLGKRELR
ncbi:hypothetical protein BJ165DRAFT_700326 [Panaeolus papilionaceus]|nr:hypothetical protein BJ165DRAFT_700326 [Panaeolus papilionaceus]